MTRWARVQSTHRTRRQPEEATPWQDFRKQREHFNKTRDCDDAHLKAAQRGIHREPNKKRKITDDERKKLKKERQLKKLQEKRGKKGLILLSEKIEKKIYRMKKGMRARGKTEEEIKQEIRLFRRKEELAYRKICAKACLSCRQPGHVVADCPKAPRVGICYKCGASDHTSTNCLQAAGGSYKFAACFVCGNQGHISRECPKNEKGAFPKGGGCRFCGSNKHKMLNCLERKAVTRRRSDDEDEFVVDVLTDAKDSADKEDHNKTVLSPSDSVGISRLAGKSMPSNSSHKPKLIKF